MKDDEVEEAVCRRIAREQVGDEEKWRAWRGSVTAATAVLRWRLAELRIVLRRDLWPRLVMIWVIAVTFAAVTWLIGWL